MSFSLFAYMVPTVRPKCPVDNEMTLKHSCTCISWAWGTDDDILHITNVNMITALQTTHFLIVHDVHVHVF